MTMMCPNKGGIDVEQLAPTPGHLVYIDTVTAPDT